MSDAEEPEYVAAFALGLGGGVTLERFRARRGGHHLMRVFHQESGLSVERTYDSTEKVFSVQSELIGQLQAKLTERGLSWPPPVESSEGPA